MRERFAWYLSPSDEEISEIWASGILTVDANVLLDLYRYHAQTRDSLMDAIRGFGERNWISDQAATEFIDNRKNVIAQADVTFREASKTIQELSNSVETAISKLRSYRLIPRNALDDLGTELKAQVERASKQVIETKAQHPDLLKVDNILDEILRIFDGKIGAAPTVEVRTQLEIDGGKRQAAKIPPGYLDDHKEGGRAFGDYILWRQALDHAKSAQKPIIFVTSEQKPDWWEERGGRKVGPRPELLKEAFLETGQRFLIYQTDTFLRDAGVRLTPLANLATLTESLEEIRDVSARRRDEGFVPAVEAVHLPEPSNPFQATGGILVQLSRPVRNFTASVSLDSATDWYQGHVDVRLREAPTEIPSSFLRAHIAQNHKLHIHCHSKEKEAFLPVGIYFFGYEVSFLENSRHAAGPAAVVSTHDNLAAEAGHPEVE